jgi:hypothetical protein
MKHSAYTGFELAHLVQLQDSLLGAVERAESKLECLRKTLLEVKGIIKRNREKKLSTVIMIPNELLNIGEVEASLESNIKWKSIVYKLLEKSTKPVSTKQLVELGRVTFPTEFSSSKKCLVSVSNALHYWHREGKVCKAKNDGRGYKYWLAKNELDKIVAPNTGFSIKKATASTVA